MLPLLLSRFLIAAFVATVYQYGLKEPDVVVPTSTIKATDKSSSLAECLSARIGRKAFLLPGDKKFADAALCGNR